MSTYLDQFDAHMTNIMRAAQAEPDAHRSTILWNYLHHAAYETAGEWELIFERDMIVDDPVYQIRDGDEVLMLEGTEDVQGFYESLLDENLLFIDEGNHELFVNDNGLAEFATEIEVKTGQQILDEEDLDAWYHQDVDIDDPDATYVLKHEHAIFWPYTQDERLIGEDIFQIAPTEIVKPDPDDVPTLDDVEAIAKQYYPENVEGDTPYAAG